MLFLQILHLLPWGRTPPTAAGTLSAGWGVWYPNEMANTWAIWLSYVDNSKKSSVFAMLQSAYPSPTASFSAIGPDMIYIILASIAENDSAMTNSFMTAYLANEKPNGGFPDPPYGYLLSYYSGLFITTAVIYINDVGTLLLG